MPKQVRDLMPGKPEEISYVDHDGGLVFATNQLTEDRQRELVEHLSSCETSLKTCPSCWELYSNVGHEKYTELLTNDMEVQE